MAAPTLATSGGIRPGLGYPGGVADGTPAIIDSKVNESATALDIGVPCVRGVAVGGQPGNVKPMAADADIIEGITVRNAAKLVASASGVISYEQYATVPVGKVGRFFVIAAEAVVEGDQVLIITAGANVNTTCWGSSHGAGGAAASGRVAFKGAKWRTTTAAGSLGIIELIDMNLGVTTT